ncbi:hypothetical protein PVAG01_10553 [Phlyctema vagabunda]|uniref:Uncharacterized protein n=1 Tax=Phlyctema vagabunda TaxID=108571 RepID=A0ABR4P2K4_9HELO
MSVKRNEHQQELSHTNFDEHRRLLSVSSTNRTIYAYPSAYGKAELEPVALRDLRANAYVWERAMQRAPVTDEA